MKTLEEIEKRRRELQYITYFLIYFLSLVVFGLFFFIDNIAGFFAALKYKFFMRTVFVGVIIGLIIYLAAKQKRQSALTKDLADEMNQASGQLRKELRNNKFLSEVSYLVSNLKDTVAMEKLFRATLNFLRADGGAVILRQEGRGLSWKPPLAAQPEQIDKELTKQICGIVSKSGRSFLQPLPDYPGHRFIKSMGSVLAVPLRLENRLYGIMAFWSETPDLFDESDLKVLEVLAREATNSNYNVALLQERTDQFQGLLRLVAGSVDPSSGNGKHSVLIANQVRSLAKEMNLPDQTADALATSAMLRHVEKLANGSAKKGVGAANILKGQRFPKRITDILEGYSKLVAGSNGTARGVAIDSQILALSEAFIDKAYPKRGRKPAPQKVLEKLESSHGDSYDGRVLAALKNLIEASS